MIHLLLDNIRSVHNVGSIFRTAEAAGVVIIYCCGTTPTPLDRFGRKRKDLAKVSLGAEDMVGWEYSKEAVAVIKKLKKEGFQVVSIEQASNSRDYREVKLKKKALIIFGNEVGGVSRSLLDASDAIAEIPMKGKKESLNVSVAAGVVLFRMGEDEI
ncbi:MAG: RNA methyltransferase [Candidatus Taylorbacteria bacterium]|nr:RNA methyltransferase [Candidatus Taylorbacteria bacterium]